LATAVAVCGHAHAHGFEERYELPVPLSYVITAACITVLLTFFLAIFFVGEHDSGIAERRESRFSISTGAAIALLLLGRILSWLLFALTLGAALWGSADPLMNLAPTMVWIVWWLGMSFASIVFGNVWPALDPWRSTADALQACMRRSGRLEARPPGRIWPPWLGMWPAVLFLLVWCWLEVVYPLASSPFRLGCAALLWSAFNLAGMGCFGRDNWQRHGDVFAIYFAALARMASMRLVRQPPALILRNPGRDLAHRQTFAVAGQVGFVLAMLSSVLFDGLHGSAAWPVFEAGLRKIAGRWMDINGYFAGTAGLLCTWLAFLLAYLLACGISAMMVPVLPRQPVKVRAARYAPALIPIAAAYLIAHNFSSLLIQGQNIFQLMSDPLGRQWDIFGTARFYPDIAVVDARLTWYVAVVSIVLGHVMSILMAHRIALNDTRSRSLTALATAPLTLLMVAYTAISLIVIAEPMVIPGP
jgi:hypothetical protein